MAGSCEFSATVIRRMQRERKVLRKRYLSPGNALISHRDAIGYANDTAFSKPPSGADATAQARWASRWSEQYCRYVSRLGRRG
jgi:hypothetical protein